MSETESRPEARFLLKEQEFQNGSLLSYRSGHGHAERKSTAHAFHALHPNLAAVQLDHPFGDRQAQAQTAVLACQMRLHLIEAIEDMFHLARRNADAIISHMHLHVAVF